MGRIKSNFFLINLLSNINKSGKLYNILNKSNHKGQHNFCKNLTENQT